MHYPYDSQQTGPEYIKWAWKGGIFGVRNYGKSNQVRYLIDEADNPVKADTGQYMPTVHGCHEKDNCVGQNKVTPLSTIFCGGPWLADTGQLS